MWVPCAMKTYLGSRGIAPRILDLRTRWKWVVSFTLQPLYTLCKSPRNPLDRSLGVPQNKLLVKRLKVLQEFHHSQSQFLVEILWYKFRVLQEPYQPCFLVWQPNCVLVAAYVSAKLFLPSIDARHTLTGTVILYMAVIFVDTWMPENV
jgi:hypothetical protein